MISLKANDEVIHMKKNELDATYENLLFTLKSDVIDRNRVLFDFMKFIDNIEGHVNISIDGDWGSGKTFFVKQAAMMLDNYREIRMGNNKSNIDERLAQILDNPPFNGLGLTNIFLTVHYDAWLHDDHDDPLLSLIYSIIKQSHIISADVTKRDSMIDRIKYLTQMGLGLCGINIDIESLLKSSESYTKKVDDAECIKDLLKQIFDDLIVENATKLIVFVDELDRCRPSYAVQLLEKIKHFFDDDRVVFVFSTNKNELTHTISNHYGANFNGTLYLNRFFDFQFSLNSIDIERYIRFINPGKDITYYDYKIQMSVGKYYNFTMREFNILYDKMNNIQSKYNPNSRRTLDRFVKIFGTVLCALSICDTGKEREFISGNFIDELMKIYENAGAYKNYVDRFLTRSGNDQIERLILYYNHFFNSNDTSIYTEIEDSVLEAISKEELLSVIYKC